MGEMFNLSSRRHQWKKEKLRFQEVENGPVKWKKPWQLSGMRHFAERELRRSETEEFTYEDLFICVFAAAVVTCSLLYHKSYYDEGTERLHTRSGKKKDEKGKVILLVADLCFPSGLKE